MDMLGRGNVAIVWLGQNNMTGEHVAMKQFPKDPASGKCCSTAFVEKQFI